MMTSHCTTENPASFQAATPPFRAAPKNSISEYRFDRNNIGRIIAKATTRIPIGMKGLLQASELKLEVI